MIVGITMRNLPDRAKGVPDIIYSQRVRKLVEHGCPESEGNLAFMCFSEVRLPGKKNESFKT